MFSLINWITGNNINNNCTCTIANLNKKNNYNKTSLNNFNFRIIRDNKIEFKNLFSKEKYLFHKKHKSFQLLSLKNFLKKNPRKKYYTKNLGAKTQMINKMLNNTLETTALG